MKQMIVSDTTLCREDCAFSFREKIEIARHLQKLKVDVIELPAIKSARSDILLVKTISSFVKDSVLSVSAGENEESIVNAVASLSAAAHPRIRIELPVSTVGMEYTFHKKAEKMLAWIETAVAMAKEQCADVELCMTDATRAESDFLQSAVRAAEKAGATRLSLRDDAAAMLPDDLAAFVKTVCDMTDLPVGVCCSDQNGLALSSAVQAFRAGAAEVKTAFGGNCASTEMLGTMVMNCGNKYGFASRVLYTELHRIAKQIAWIASHRKNEGASVTSAEQNDSIHLDAEDSRDDVAVACAKLGYDLSQEDLEQVYAEFCRVAEKKPVGARELDAIVATAAMQMPATYHLQSYVVNNGNIISSSAQITLRKEERELQGICIGDGPIDAAFRAIEQIIGHHYELDDFQIQSVTEGKEAMGSALVRLRANGKLYSGNGLSTDIIGASIRAYLSAVNKIVYEETGR